MYLVAVKDFKSKTLTDLSNDIIKTLLYYDIFSYPLTLEEIYFSSSFEEINKNEIENELNSIINLGIVFKHNNFFSLQENSEIAKRRIEGNKLAYKKIKTAKIFSKIISKFPFVRSVLLSGSLSKGYMDEKSDIDYFIITAPNKLWISRFSLMLFKKIFLFNSKKNFCINYFITTEKLKIEEKNVYIAVELATLIPTYGIEYYELLCSANKWVKEYFPNHPFKNKNGIKNFKKSLAQKIIEPLLNNNLGLFLDNFCMNLFYKYDKKKYSNYDEQSFNSSFKIKKNISTHHPCQFQNKVLLALEQKIKLLQVEHNILIN